MNITLKYSDEDGEELEIELPAKFEVCSDCEGHGAHLTPSMREHAYSAEEFRESFDDEEAEEYCRRGGRYDVTCETCKGARVMPIVDEKKLSNEQMADYIRWQKSERQRARWAREDAATYRMENGGYE